MGGPSRSCSTSTVTGFDHSPLASDLARRFDEQLEAKMADCCAHVTKYHQYQEYINRPWTWKNRAAWLINKLIGE